jgi:segregation and condensation protein B
MKQLEDRGWVEVIGHKETIGRPGLYATTKQFLDDLSLTNLQSLPILEDAAPMAAAEQLGQAVMEFDAEARVDTVVIDGDESMLVEIEAVIEIKEIEETEDTEETEEIVEIVMTEESDNETTDEVTPESEENQTKHNNH